MTPSTARSGRSVFRGSMQPNASSFGFGESRTSLRSPGEMASHKEAQIRHLRAELSYLQSRKPRNETHYAREFVNTVCDR